MTRSVRQKELLGGEATVKHRLRLWEASEIPGEDEGEWIRFLGAQPFGVGEHAEAWTPNK